MSVRPAPKLYSSPDDEYRCTFCRSLWLSHLRAADVRLGNGTATTPWADDDQVRVSDCVTVLMAEVAKHKTDPHSTDRADMDRRVMQGDLANAQAQLATAQRAAAETVATIQSQSDEIHKLTVHVGRLTREAQEHRTGILADRATELQRLCDEQATQIELREDTLDTIRRLTIGEDIHAECPTSCC